MIRNAVCALRRTPVAASLRRATPGQLFRHPLPASQIPAASSLSSSARGLHGVAAGSGLLRAHTVPLLPGMSPAAASSMAAAARRLNTAAAGGSMEETRSALMQGILDQEHKKAAAAAATAAAARDKKETNMEKAKREVLARVAAEKAAQARKAGKKAKMEEMMALISRQVAAGEAPDREALLLVRSARADLEIEQLKNDVKIIKFNNHVLCGTILAFVVYASYRVEQFNKKVRKAKIKPSP